MRKVHIALLALLVCLLILASPAAVSAIAGLGGYISEQLLGDGINETLHLGDGANALTVIGSGPVVTTLAVTNNTTSGSGAIATLRGNLTDLNGMPRADVWFVWGYSAGALSNTTPAVTVTATGVQTANITANSGQRVYYQFRASTDGTSSGATNRASYWMLHTLLPIVIAAAIVVLTLMATGNPLIALTGAVMGLLAFRIVEVIVQLF